jgi:outer membrane protein TolC
LAAGCTITPDPLTESDLQVKGGARLERIAGARTPVNGTLTLKAAIARAVQYNLDHRVEMYETALRTAEVNAATAQMLPSLVAGGASSNRNRPLASSSYNLVTNTQNFGYSTSQDESLRTADLALSWNILDFGLSYVRARQAADKVLIAQENRRRVVQKLVEEVRSAYWRAYAADITAKRLKSLEHRTLAALSSARQQADDRTSSPITAITYRRELIEIRRTLQELQRELASAKIQLAALINERPDANFKLALPSAHVATALYKQSAGSLIATAMEKRPELREISYRRRINGQELDAALLELLPGIQLFAGNNSDSNSFLLHDNWVNWGAKASWNVMRLVQYPARREVIEAQDAALAEKDLATTLAVMTQIHVSRARIAVIAREVHTAKAYSDTQRELLGHIRAEHKADRVSEQTLLREELNDAVSEIRKLLAEANLESAHASLAVAVGIDPPTYTEQLPELPKIGNAAASRQHFVRTSMHSP